MPEIIDQTMPTEAVTLPVLPLRDIVIFPYMVAPLFVGRPQSIGALEKASADDKYIFLVSQKDSKVDSPTEEDLYQVGTIGKVSQLLKLPDGTVKVLVEGCWRARMLNFQPGEDLQTAEVEAQEESLEDSPEVAAVMRAINTTFESYAGLSKKLPAEISTSVAGIESPTRMADTVVGHLQIPLADKQEVLELLDPAHRLEHILVLLEQEIEILQIEGRIRSRVKNQMERSQKEYYLNEQMRAIQKELGEKDEFKQEILEFEAQIKKKRMSKEATEKAQAELRKLKMMSPMSAEATVVRNYIECLLALPWKKVTKDCHDLLKAEAILILKFKAREEK